MNWRNYGDVYSNFVFEIVWTKILTKNVLPFQKTGDDSPCASSSAVSSKNGAREEAEGENGPRKAKRFAPNRGHEAESDEVRVCCLLPAYYLCHMCELNSLVLRTRILQESGRPSSSTRRDDVNDSRSKQRSKRDILEGVVFVLSGFQNPLRKQLRDTALSMGAKWVIDMRNWQLVALDTQVWI